MIFKKLLFIAVFIADVLLMFWIIAKVGFKTFFLFMITYLAGVIITGIIFRKYGYLDIEDWKIFKGPKLKYIRLVWIPIILLTGLGLCYLTQIPAYVAVIGTLTGLLIVTFMATYTRDLLYAMHEHFNTFSRIIEESRQVKKLVDMLNKRGK